jgi:ribosomal protein L32E
MLNIKKDASTIKPDFRRKLWEYFQKFTDFTRRVKMQTSTM